MNCENICVMISAYIDNELPKEQEGFLFTHLASCGGCREEFKAQTRIQNAVKINQKEVNGKFEERIYDSIEKREAVFTRRLIAKQTPAYINYLLGAVILMIMLISFLQVSSLRRDLDLFQERYETSIKQLNYQAGQMYLMMNSIPAVEIKQY